MKKISTALFVICFVAAQAAFCAPMMNAKTKSAINMYKNKNYTECLQVMHEVVQKDPSNVLGYYYIAISQARLGNVDKAKEAYQRVIDLNTSTQLTKYSKNGIECLDDATKCKTVESLDPTKKAIDAVNKQLEEKRLDSVKDIVNQKQNIQEVPIEYMRDFKDYSRPNNQLQNKKSDVPSQEEVAQALDTLKRAGYQNYMPQPAYNSQQMMQMSMLNSLGGNNNSNNNNDYMTYLMSLQNTDNKVDPQMIQTMMMSNMMKDMYSTDSNNR